MYQKFKLGMYRDMLCLHGEIGVFIIMRALTWQRVICLFIRYLVELFVVGGGLQGESYTKKYGRGIIFGKNPVKLHH
jgi:hypothetical protein